MPNPILILHGWSDNYQSFAPLKVWFNANGYTAESVFLASYESMEDHVTGGVTRRVHDGERHRAERQHVAVGEVAIRNRRLIE